jgi:hypothetical protein
MGFVVGDLDVALGHAVGHAGAGTGAGGVGGAIGCLVRKNKLGQVRISLRF